MCEGLFNSYSYCFFIPFGGYCSVWPLRQAIRLSGITYSVLQEEMRKRGYSFNNSRLQRNAKYNNIRSYLIYTSSAPQKTQELFNKLDMNEFFAIIPSAVLVLLTIFGKNFMAYALMADFVLFLMCVAFLVAERIYIKNNPVDEKFLKRAERIQKRAKQNKRVYRRDVSVTLIFSALFFVVFVLVCSAFISKNNKAEITTAPTTQQTENQTNYTEDNYYLREKLCKAMEHHGFETYNIPVTYWEINEDDLLYVCAGIKEDEKIEYYYYYKNVDIQDVYHAIISDVAPGLNPEEYAKFETVVSESSRAFFIRTETAHNLIVYKENTIIYAHSSEAMYDVYDILSELNYYVP